MSPARLLFVSNYYPPHALGGYEMWCHEVATGLRARGHEVSVLTSRLPGRRPSAPEEGPVYRTLYLELEGGLLHTVGRLSWTRDRRERQNLAQVERLLQEIQPDRVILWGMWNVPRSVPALLERAMPGRVLYYLCDYWPTLPSAYLQRWQEPARHPALKVAKRCLARGFAARAARPLPTLALERPVCVSHALQRELMARGAQVAHGTVLYGGIDVTPYARQRPEPRAPHAPLRLVFLGRLVPDKGLHTLLEALAHLPAPVQRTLSLDIFGRGDPGYEARLRAQAQQSPMAPQIRFHGQIPHERVPRALAGRHVLVFPSEWPEPFARTVLEAMAAGLAVVGSTAGGTPEILVEKETGLLFPPGDAQALASQLLRLAQDEPLRRQIAAQGQRRVLQHFTLARMVEDFEALCTQELPIPSSPVGGSDLG